MPAEAKAEEQEDEVTDTEEEEEDEIEEVEEDDDESSMGPDTTLGRTPCTGLRSACVAPMECALQHKCLTFQSCPCSPNMSVQQQCVG